MTNNLLRLKKIYVLCLMYKKNIFALFDILIQTQINPDMNQVYIKTNTMIVFRTMANIHRNCTAKV